jgi:hemerythrin-like domain-containing protein
MDYARRVPATIHREHLETLGLLERLEAAAAKSKSPPAPGDQAWARLCAELDANLAHDVGRHFDFEEQELFPLLAGAGDRDIAHLLAEEHRAIRELAGRVRASIRAGGAVHPAWGEFRLLALELVERQVAHIQKEEMSLLPMLEDALEVERDGELLNRYLAIA